MKLIELVLSKELEQLNCSILFRHVKEKVSRLKAYGVDKTEIVATMNEKVLFPQPISDCCKEITIRNGSVLRGTVFSVLFMSQYY